MDGLQLVTVSHDKDFMLCRYTSMRTRANFTMARPAYTERAIGEDATSPPIILETGCRFATSARPRLALAATARSKSLRAIRFMEMKSCHAIAGNPNHENTVRISPRRH